jgi:hypothetical protein
MFEIFDDHDVSLNRILKIIPQITPRRSRRGSKRLMSLCGD